MKVLMLLDNAFKPDLRVMKEARILIKKGFDVSLLCWDRHSNLPEETREEQIDVKRFKIRSGHQLGVFQIKHLLKFYISVFPHIWKRRREYDLLWVHDYTCLLLGVILKLLLHLPLIYDAHEIYYFMEYEKYSPFIRSLLKYSEILFLQYVDKLITVNEIRSQYYKKYFFKRIYIVGNWFAPIDVKGKLRQTKSSEGRFTIGYFGTLAKSRNLDLLLELAKKGQGISILIAGSGVEEDNVKRKSSNLKNVKFLGWISNIYSILPKVDALYYVLDKERIYSYWSSPNTIYLAIAANIPLITNAIGESGEIMKNVEPNIILKRNSPEELIRVVSLLRDKDFYKSLKKKMLLLQKQYNLKKVEEAIFSIINTVFSAFYVTK